MGLTYEESKRGSGSFKLPSSDLIIHATRKNGREIEGGMEVQPSVVNRSILAVLPFDELDLTFCYCFACFSKPAFEIQLSYCFKYSIHCTAFTDKPWI